MSANVDLTELRQNTSELMRRAHAGEEITITVSGHPSARLTPAKPTRWRRWDEIAPLFDGPDDPDREQDRGRVTDDLRDPWDER